NQHYGSNFTVVRDPSAMVDNWPLWSQAARAYYLLAAQNPQLSAAEGPNQVRADSIFKNGVLVRDHASQLNTPAATGLKHINPLFTGLFRDYLTKLGSFVSAAQNWARDSQVMNPQRQFDLWGDINQPVDVNALGTLQQSVPDCNGGSNVVPPSFVDGKNL